MHDLAGKVMGIILAFLLVVIMPFVTVAVENTSDQPIEVQNANLIVVRVA